MSVPRVSSYISRSAMNGECLSPPSLSLYLSPVQSIFAQKQGSQPILPFPLDALTSPRESPEFSSIGVSLVKGDSRLLSVYTSKHFQSHGGISLKKRLPPH